MSDCSPAQRRVLETEKLSGILVKRGASVRSWKARYFSVEEDQITYFKHEDDSTPIGHISFRDIPSIDNVRGSFLKRYCFKIQTLKRAYYMMCQSAKEQKHWITALRVKIQKFTDSNEAELKTLDMLEAAGRERNDLTGSLKGNIYKARQLFQEEKAKRASKRGSRKSQSRRQSRLYQGDQDVNPSQYRTRPLGNAKYLEKKQSLITTSGITGKRVHICLIPPCLLERIDQETTGFKSKCLSICKMLK